ncbi:6-phosphofructokinase 2 [Glycine soja]|uniref:6-phosphofructokinase 2 n=1 Tax=Glycine soja TaxID=3848 RepID=A0A0B2S0I2_GLYSO|nr:6-phosphofructokinase 2 [Glycine soja]
MSPTSKAAPTHWITTPTLTPASYNNNNKASTLQNPTSYSARSATISLPLPASPTTALVHAKTSTLTLPLFALPLSPAGVSVPALTPSSESLSWACGNSMASVIFSASPPATGGFTPLSHSPSIPNSFTIGTTSVAPSFRHPGDLHNIVDAIQTHAFNQVYIIGGDGTMRGAVKIFDEIKHRKLEVAVVGIPKTVDNDVGIIDSERHRPREVDGSKHRPHCSSCNAQHVDCCLIPEIDFFLEGKGGLLEFLGQRLKENGHAVLVVAEGAGQDIIPRTDSQKDERDESGNPVFLDVGVWLKSELNKWWKREHPNELFTVKYIDPTYMIRAVHANATDNLYCTLLAHSAIHGVMAGYTGFVAGPINGNYAYIPLEDVARANNPVDTQDHKWSWVRSVTNQPDFVRR